MRRMAHIFAANLVEHLHGALSGESMVISKLNRSLAKQDPEGTLRTRSSS
jgi:hypothetical protein